MGPTAQALTGLTHLVGLPDREPAGWSFSYLDHVGGYLGAFGVLTALAHRRATGEGQHVDVSQLEPATALGGAAAARPLGERPVGAPPGLPARQPSRRRAAGRVPRARRRPLGRDLVQHRRALAARSSPRSGTRRGADDARFATLAGRVEHADELDGHVEAWTATRDRYEVMELLQQAGVPAGAVQDAADRVERDPQLAARGHFTTLASTEVGELPLEGVPFSLSATPAAHRRHDPPRAAGPRRGLRRHPARRARPLGRRDRTPPRIRSAAMTATAGAARRAPGGGARRRAGRVLRPVARRARRRRHQARAGRRRAEPRASARTSTVATATSTRASTSGTSTSASDPRSSTDDETIRRVLRVRGRGDPHAPARRAPRHAASTTTSLAATNPGLISCAITPFGLTGPWADYLADDLVLMALGGSMAVCGYGTDDPPLACWGDQAWSTAATYGAIAVLAALEHRGQHRRGAADRRLGAPGVGVDDRVARHDVPLHRRRRWPGSGTRPSPPATASRSPR